MTKVFISYSRKDLTFVRQLASDLEKAGLDVWYDLTDLEGGDRWATAIQSAIASSDMFITVVSPNSVASEWVSREFIYAERRKKKILPLLYQKCELPIWLTTIHNVDIQGKNYRINFQHILDTIEKAAPAPIVEQPPEPEPAPQPAARKGSMDWARVRPYGLLAVAGAVVIALALGLPRLFQNPPAVAVVSETPTLRPLSTATKAPTDTSIPPSETPQPGPAPTEAFTPTLTPIPSPYPAEITDGQGVEMVLIPAGIFTMGSNIFNEEAPIHRVALDDYYIDKFEVTNALYRDCERAGICDPPRANFSALHADYYSASDFEDYPVIFVDWDMAATYCETWRGAHLPSEAQWEKAARSPDGRKYPWGDGTDCFHTNYWVTSNPACVGDTTRVGSYVVGASPYGVYDMAGNVWEWVNDSYNALYYGSLPDGFENPTGPARDFNSIVIRGGGWDSGVNGVRSAYRGYQPHTYYANNLGFRCARDINP